MRFALHLLLWILIYLKLLHIHDGLSSTSVSVGLSVKTLKNRFWSFKNIASESKNVALISCLLILSGDIQTNPGPTNNARIYPCGLCELPVTSEHIDGIECDGCQVWHHRSCTELCSTEFDFLAKHYHVQWLCCKCDRVNISSFTFRSYELFTLNVYN